MIHHFLSIYFFKPLRLVAVPQPQKPSDEVTPRQIRNRTKTLQTLGTAVSGGKSTIHLIQQLKAQKQECRQLLNEALGKDLVLQVPEGEALAMKADIGLPWFRLNKLRR